ncbi:MAG: phosphoglycerate mutase family protein [Ferruginibacter sp.]
MKKLLKLLILLVVCFVYGTAAGQPGFKGKRTIYFVRHAEKDTGSNPVISAAGKERAGDLYRVLQHKKIDLIMATQYRRTGMTADSLRIYQHIDSIQYKADLTGDDFLAVLNSRAGKAKNILVVGHSNALPALIRKAGIENYMVKELPETEFDHLFIVTQKKGKASLRQLKYGRPSDSL